MSVVETDQPAKWVGRILINCPEKRNALTLEVKHGVRDAVSDALKAPDIRAIIITGRGGAFSAGGDISDMAKRDENKMLRHLRVAHDTVRLCDAAQKPMIAAIEGPAMGSGSGLALCADTIVAGENAMIGFPFQRMGLIPDYGTMHTLTRRIGFNKARQAFLFAKAYKSPEALELGLFDHVVDDNQVQGKAIELAEQLAKLPAYSMAMTKRILSKMPTSVDTALELESHIQTLCMRSDEHLEGSTAFMEKRKPDFLQFELLPGRNLPV